MINLRSIFLALGLLCILLPATASVEGAFIKIEEAQINEDYGTELRVLKRLALDGSPYSQYNLGIIYDQAIGVPRDPREAVKWFRLAADQGYEPAQYHLGNLHAQGYGQPKMTRLR